MIWRNIPNIITIARFFLIVPIAYFQLNGMYAAALIVFAIAGLSDGIDGFLAKRYQWVSRLGSLLDPLADKCLLISITAILTFQSHIPFWLFLLILVRDIIIVTGATSYQIIFGKVPMEPNLSSKTNTLFQILMVLYVMLTLAFWPDKDPYSAWLFFVVALTTIISGAEYVVHWTKYAMNRWKAHHDQ